MFLEEEGLEILEAGDGHQALEVLETRGVDLVITDNKMPNMTGLELIRAAKARFPSLPFIVVSTRAEAEDFGPSEPRAIISKPIPLDELKQQVDEVLNETV